jgi:ankyrin repeat protein
MEATRSLLDNGAKIDAINGDNSTSLLLSIINGHFDIAKLLVERGADVTLPSMDGATPLYGVVNTQWARKSFQPQPSPRYEKTTYLELMTLLLDRGADPNARITKDLWYSAYNRVLESASAAGTTAFWKCAEVGDIDGMRLLVSRGADPNIASVEGVTPLLMAAGAGVHGNDDVTAPAGRLAGIKYLVEELHADVNAADIGSGNRGQNAVGQVEQQAGQQQVERRPSGGFTALHNAAARGDNAMILYLVSKGAKADAVSRAGVTVADMANGPRQRIQPYPETVALLEQLGSKNSHKCVSC